MTPDIDEAGTWQAPELDVDIYAHPTELPGRTTRRRFTARQRAAHRSRAYRIRARRHNNPDLPWVGAIPRVGAGMAPLRAAMRGHNIGPTQTAVRVDVVPVIHQRAERGTWSARWSGARILHRDQHHTYTAPTTIAPGPSTDLAGRVDPVTLHPAAGTTAGDPGTTTDPAHTRAAARTTTPTRGPNLRRYVAQVAVMT